jgi:hypothetical protein
MVGEGIAALFLSRHERAENETPKRVVPGEGLGRLGI